MKLCTELPSFEESSERIILLFYNFTDLHKWWAPVFVFSLNQNLILFGCLLLGKAGSGQKEFARACKCNSTVKFVTFWGRSKPFLLPFKLNRSWGTLYLICYFIYSFVFLPKHTSNGNGSKPFSHHSYCSKLLL